MTLNLFPPIFFFFYKFYVFLSCFIFSFVLKESFIFCQTSWICTALSLTFKLSGADTKSNIRETSHVSISAATAVNSSFLWVHLCIIELFMLYAFITIFCSFAIVIISSCFFSLLTIIHLYNFLKIDSSSALVRSETCIDISFCYKKMFAQTW